MYLVQFKQLMISIDPDDPDDDDNAPAAVGGGVAMVNGNVTATPNFDPSRRSIMIDPETGLMAPSSESDAVATPHHIHAVSIIEVF